MTDMRKLINICEGKKLSEAPISDFGSYGDSAEGSFRPEDLRAMRNPKWIEKTHRMFSKCPYNFNIFFYNVSEEAPLALTAANKNGFGPKSVRNLQHTSHFTNGLVSREYVKSLLGRNDVVFDNRITLLLAENEGDERFPLSPWIVAHRAMHAMLQNGKYMSEHIFSEGRKLLTDIGYLETKEMTKNGMFLDDKNIMKLIGSTAAQRSGNIIRVGEFYVEAGTQFIVQGRVKFNQVTSDMTISEASDAKIPQEIAQKINEISSKAAETLTELFSNVCRDNVGNC